MGGDLGGRGRSTKLLQFRFGLSTWEGSGSAGALLTNYDSQGHSIIIVSETTWHDLIRKKNFSYYQGCGLDLQKQWVFIIVPEIIRFRFFSALLGALETRTEAYNSF